MDNGKDCYCHARKQNAKEYSIKIACKWVMLRGCGCSVESDQNNPRKSVQTILIGFLNCEKKTIYTSMSS